jgi:hypothetical protein
MKTRIALAAILVILFTHCGSEMSALSPDAGAPDASIPWPANALEIIATRSAGYYESPCGLSDGGMTPAFFTSSFKLNLVAKQIEFVDCRSQVNPMVRTGTKALSRAQLTTLDNTVKKLKKAEPHCAYDGPHLELRVDSATEIQFYTEVYSASACGQNMRAIAVDGFAEVLSAIQSFTIP